MAFNLFLSPLPKGNGNILPSAGKCQAPSGLFDIKSV